MKSLNGGKGMSDEQVSKCVHLLSLGGCRLIISFRFVDRYIPGYVFFGDGVVIGGKADDGTPCSPPWLGNGLRIQIGETREVLNVDQF